MEEREVDRELTTISEARRNTGPIRSLRVSKQAKTSTASTEKQLALTQSRMAEHLISGRVRERWLTDPVTGKAIECVFVGDSDAVTQMNRLAAQRSLLWHKLGPERISGWFPYHFHHNGRAYCLDPYVAWISDLHAALDSDLRVRGRVLTARDSVIWLLWYFRNKVVVRVGRLDSKIRGNLRECAQCKHRYRFRINFDPAKWKPGCCPKCGYLGAKHIEPKAVLKPIGRITKAGLRRRFKLSPRTLERILSATPDPRFPESPTI